MLKDVLEETEGSIKVPMVKPNIYKHIKAGFTSVQLLTQNAGHFTAHANKKDSILNKKL